MTTVKQLIEILNKYPGDMPVTDQQNQNFVHISNIQDTLIISTDKPIGYCNRSGEYVYPSIIDTYAGFSPSLDEDLFTHEFTLIKK